MGETLSRVEFEDQLRHLTVKLDRAASLNAATHDEVVCVSRSLAIATFQIKQLWSLLVPLLSAEQRELLGVEARAGVTTEPLVDERSVEANDAREFSALLRCERSEPLASAKRETGSTVTLGGAQLDALKTLGSMFVVQPNDEGPCFNRDRDDLVDRVDLL